VIRKKSFKLGIFILGKLVNACEILILKIVIFQKFLALTGLKTRDRIGFGKLQSTINNPQV